MTTSGFQNKVLTKGTVFTKYIYGNKIDWIIFTRSIKHYMSLINLKRKYGKWVAGKKLIIPDNY